MFVIFFFLAAVIGFGALIFRSPDKNIFKVKWGSEAYDPVKNRINFYGHEVFINNSHADLRTRNVSIHIVFTLKESNNEIVFYEDSKKVEIYKVASPSMQTNLKGWYLHTSIRVDCNSTVQMKGILSKYPDKYDIDTDGKITFEPFKLSF